MITIRPSTDRDHAEIVTIGNGVNSDRLSRSVEGFRSAIRSQPPAASAQSYVAEAGGKVVGHLWLNRLIYVPNPHVWYADIQVHPGAQARGIGGQLYEFLLDCLADHRAQHVHAHVREDLSVARRFVRRRGFRETGHGDRPSRLEVRIANTEPGRKAAERLKGEGVQISRLEELGGTEEEVLRDLHRLTNETYADIPSSRQWTFMPFDEWQRLRTEAGERPDMVWVAKEGGGVVGLATLLHSHEGSAYAGHTGVARTHRGRGIARALKHCQVTWARRHGVDYLCTENDVENAPMLRINTDMGYRPLPADDEVIKNLGVDGREEGG